jgi:hypothetical protein
MTQSEIITNVVGMVNQLLTCSETERTNVADNILDCLLGSFKEPSEYGITQDSVRSIFEHQQKNKDLEFTADYLASIEYGAIPLATMRYVMGIRKIFFQPPKKNWELFVHRYISILPGIM